VPSVPPRGHCAGAATALWDNAIASRKLAAFTHRPICRWLGIFLIASGVTD
jgi:hypothetical protein